MIMKMKLGQLKSMINEALTDLGEPSKNDMSKKTATSPVVAQLSYGGHGSCAAVLSNGIDIDFDELIDFILADGDEDFNVMDLDMDGLAVFGRRVMVDSLKLAGATVVVDPEDDNPSPQSLDAWASVMEDDVIDSEPFLSAVGRIKSMTKTFLNL